MENKNIAKNLENKGLTAIRRGRNRLSRVDKNIWFILLQFALFIAICVVHSLDAAHYVDFYPINGTYQNYNPVRRLLDGQIPYRDFQDYLGLGHLYVGSFCTFIFGGNYKASLWAFSFLQFLGMGLCSFVIGKAVFKRTTSSLAVTNLLLVCIIIQPLIFKNAIVGTDEMLGSVMASLGPGNSARFLRGMILPIAIMCLYPVVDLYGQHIDKSSSVKSYKIWIITGIIGGFSFVWSSDYGVSSWLCLAIMLTWAVFCINKKVTIALMALIVESFSSIIAIFVIVEIVTLGHFPQWVSATFGTGGYQSWYYNSGKSFYLLDVDFSFIMCIQAGITLFCLVKIFLNSGSLKSLKCYGALGLANMTCLCAVNEYKVLSGGYAREVALSVLYVTILFEFINVVKNTINIDKKHILVVVETIVCLSWLFATFKDELTFRYLTDKDGIYVEELGGNITVRGEDLLKTNAFLSGDLVWATYASAQEVVDDRYQPSGTDYIIHVMGDAQRKYYLQRFNEGDFRYAATIKEDLSDWEYWIQRANWWFYRELYRDWHPVYDNSYELYWERNLEDNENVISDGIKIELKDIDDCTKKIVVTCDSSVNGFADVLVDYDVKRNNSKSALLNIQKMLHVENTGKVYATNGASYESNYLRSDSSEYIPVRVVNGYGEVTITSVPEKSTFLQLNSYSCDAVYTVTSDYTSIVSIADDRMSFGIPYGEKNVDNIANIKKTVIQDQVYEVDAVEVIDGQITIYTHNPIVYIEGKSNQIKLLR